MRAAYVLPWQQGNVWPIMPPMHMCKAVYAKSSPLLRYTMDQVLMAKVAQLFLYFMYFGCVMSVSAGELGMVMEGMMDREVL